MVQITYAKDISLYTLNKKFGLQSNDELFIESWLTQLPDLTELDHTLLKRIVSNYINLTNRRPMSEEAVKMVILSPLLDLAGFYQPPFDIETEKPIKISAQDDGAIVKGKIDVLVVQKQLWILVIEAKRTRFDVMVALPQALACMLASPNSQTYGLLISGREFVFVKLTQHNPPQYTLSKAFSILPPAQDLPTILQILKYLARLLSQ
jgi:hypothetical protein